MNVEIKITFSRQALSDYKNKSLQAIVSGYNTFVHKGSLVKVDDAQRLINAFKPHFINKDTNEVTIPYNF